MMRPTLPDGFEVVRAEGALIVVRPELREWVKEAVESGGTLYHAARRVASHTAMGRAPVPVVEAEGGRFAVRHFMRGGRIGPILHDRYLRGSTPRPFAELRSSAEVAARGVPTPEVLAAAFYPSGLFYRGDLITRFIPQAADLARVLFEDPPPPLEVDVALAAAGSLIRSMALAGVHHVDLNARNILLVGDPSPGAWVLDLDRCRLSGPAPDRSDSMRRRLERSLRKLERAAGRPLPPAAWATLRTASAVDH